ncbi:MULTISPECIES: DEAD/DEAH box helicase [unclassified Kitasatospora]|uniref:DEAD/DEAH box helicase n=1 Tax=unclassified Kitasatospora TaxID=2633591 RepID=UPI002475576F|nr:DEAD/DEAH box helicase [Kitasatospora sp. MAP12-44]
MTLPVAMTGHDVIGQAKTGTGKTLGFGLPLIERVVVRADIDAGRATEAQLCESPQALIVVPTRELCTQVTNDLQTAGKVRDVRVLAIYGGRAYEPQVEALKKGVDIVVGTPGRLLDLAGQKKLDLSRVKALVLDEADEMLDLGFLPDVEKILTMLPAKRQTLLFSATMPGQVISLARRYMSQPTHIRAAAPDDTGHTVASVTQHIFRAHSLDKVEMVSRILQSEGRGLAMIFCRTKRTAADVSDQLTQRGFAAGAVHGDLGQGAREQALRAFRAGKVDVLVCTDVAARGIDVEGVTHVMNYQCPEDEKTYLHRIGRTGRAGASGTAVTLVDWDDIPRWALINKALELGFGEPEETYSTSAHLYELLKIAPGTTGVLPRSERTRAGLGAEAVEDLGETGGRGSRSGGARGSERGSDRGGERAGDRPRGGRGGAERSTGRRGAGGDAVETPAAEERAPRTPRERRRTRGGSAGADVAAVAATSVTGGPTEAPVAGGEGESAPRRRRRRPRSGGAGGEGTAPVAAVFAEPVAAAEPAPAQAPAPAPAPTQAAVLPAQATAPAAAGPVTTQRKPVQRAPRKIRAITEDYDTPQAPAAVVETPVVKAPVVKAVAPVEVVAEAVVVAEPAATKPRKTAAKRTTKKAAAPVEAPVEVIAEVVAEVVAEEAPVKPRKAAAKRTTKKAAAAVEAPVDVVAEAVAEEAPAKVTRTRKAAAKKTAAKAPVEAVAADAPAAEAPVKKATARRTTAKKAAAKAPVEAVAAEAPAAEAEEAPRRRTRARRPATTVEETPAAG